jgi:ubiquitin-activating enzyme E1
VHCTDNDNIEVSNLNRQFLFRQGNVGHSKSETACSKAKDMNPELNVQAYTSLCAPETEEVFNDKLWESLDFVVNAVDNVKARLYVDSKCVWYEKPLLESGTLGTKANSQMVIPHKTLCYGDSQDPPEESIPMCTLRNFPNQIEHCIEWGRDQFNTLFVDRVQDALSYLDKPEQFLLQQKQNQTSSAAVATLVEIKKLFEMKQTSDFARCVEIARDTFVFNFDHNIRDLMNIFPKDHLDSHGMPFWSGPKRAPDHITFDANDASHLAFIQAMANLIAFNLGMPEVRDIAAIKEMVGKLSYPQYLPKTIKVETPEEAKAREERKEPAPVAGSAPEDDDLLK